MAWWKCALYRLLSSFPVQCMRLLLMLFRFFLACLYTTLQFLYSTGASLCRRWNYTTFLLTLTAYSMRSSVYETVERPSVCLSHRSAAACGGFVAERPAGRRYRPIASAGAQRHNADSVTLKAEGRGWTCTDLLLSFVRCYSGDESVNSNLYLFSLTIFPTLWWNIETFTELATDVYIANSQQTVCSFD